MANDEKRPPAGGGPPFPPEEPTLTAGHSIPAGDDVAVFEPGREFGAYRIVRILGRGGMGTVYEAEELASRRRVALKVLTHRLLSPEHRERFLREGRLTAAINHPNSVYIFGTGESEGVPWISMELVRGGTLRDPGALSPDGGHKPAVDAILQVIAGLAASSQLGILHRDVKPSNCFIDAGGTVKVGDFGLSISTTGTDDVTRSLAGSILGTPAFASPEQLRGEALDARSDQYSVGATLYWLLCGRAPFTEQGVQLIGSILGRPAAFDAGCAARLPAGLMAIVLRCLAKDAAERYPDYAALSEALRPYGSERLASSPLRPRAVAGVVDTLAASVGQALIGVLLVAVRPSLNLDTWAFNAGAAVVVWLGFAFAEGRWGRTPGRLLCGLLVTGPDDRPPGFARALWRGAVFNVPGALYAVLGGHSDAVVGVAGVAWLTVLFLPAFRGHAALHDRASSTRVVVRRAPPPALPVPASASPPAPHTAVQYGPFVAARRVHAAGAEWVDEAVDSLLERPVWIHARGAGSAPPTETRQDLARRTRPRWLQRGGTLTEPWDAYGMPAGMPFVVAAQSTPDWSVVRIWVQDAAAEFAAAAAEPGRLRVDECRLWVGHDGHLLVCDFPVTSSNEAPAGGFDSTDLAAAQRFLYGMAATALCGRPRQENAALAAAGLPIRIRRGLERLRAMECGSWEAVLSLLAEIAAVDTAVTRPRRAAQILSYAVVPLLLAATWSPGPDLPTTRLTMLWAGLLGVFVQGLLVTAVSVAAVLFTREGLLVRLFGMGWVNSDGELPSGFALAARAVVCGALCLPLCLAQAGRTPHHTHNTPLFEAIALGGFAVLVAGAVASIRNPQCGPLEVITGMRLVRR